MVTDKSVYTVGLIGCGAISRKHIDAILGNPDRFRLAAVFDIDRERAAAAAAASGSQCRSFSSTAEMADECRPDVVAIATPSALHAEQAIFWMEHGAHLVLEKPVALSTADIDRIAATKAQTGRTIAVGYVLRYAPQVRLLARMIGAGRFGRILHASLSLYWNRNDDYYTAAPWRGTWENDGGSLMNQATHGIDLLQWVLGGDPVNVTGRLGRFLRPIEADDFASAIVGFANGAVGTIQATVCTYPTNLGTRITILGERGTVELFGNGPDAITTWRFPDDSEWRDVDTAVAAGVVPDAADVKTGHAGVYEDLARALDERTEPLVGFDAGRVSAEIVLGILKSHRDTRPVDFPVTFATADMKGTVFA